MVDFPEPIRDFTPFSTAHWQPLYELATNQLNVQAQWWRAMRRSDFQVSLEQQLVEWFWHTLGRSHIYRRCIRSARRFEAALILTAQRWHGPHKLELWVRPENYGYYEAALLQWSLATLQEYPRSLVQVSLNTDHAAGLEVFQQFGFHSVQTLLTMRRKIDD